MTDIQIDVGPLVQVVLPEGERVFPFSDLAFETDDPATISDPDLIARVARHLDREVEEFGDLMVSRPRTGNILISEKPVFGYGYKIVRTNEEIADVENWAAEGEDSGSHFPGTSYENGLLAMLRWLTDSDASDPRE